MPIAYLALLFFVSLALSACATPRRIITLSSETDLAAVSVREDYAKLKKKYSVSQIFDLGPDPTLEKESLNLAKQNIHYEAPHRKLEVTATLWDLPLIKAYLKDQKFGMHSGVGEEVRMKLLEDHRQYTQILLAVDSYVEQYFQWPEWNIWLEDIGGKRFSPSKVEESTQEELILPVDKEILGKRSISPGYKIYHSYGTLYFPRIDLEEYSPFKLMLMEKGRKREIGLGFSVTGGLKPGDETGAIPREKSVSTPLAEVAAPVLISSGPAKISPHEAMRLHFEQATAYYRNKQYQMAISEWEKVLELDPAHVLSRQKIAKVREMIKEAEKEEKVYSEKQRQRQMQVHFLMATELYKSGQYDEAIREWEAVLKLNPNHDLSKEKIKKAREKLGDR